MRRVEVRMIVEIAGYQDFAVVVCRPAPPALDVPGVRRGGPLDDPEHGSACPRSQAAVPGALLGFFLGFAALQRGEALR